MEGYKVAIAWLPCLVVMVIGSIFRAMVHPREMVEYTLSALTFQVDMNGLDD